MSFTVVILGRPNVGKSTLFNRLAGRRLALVDNTPGVTRDRREGQGRLGDLEFRIVDTAGLEEGDEKSLFGRMRSQTEAAIEGADLALMMIDARAGVTPLDEYFAAWLRKKSLPVVLVANKSEGAAGDHGVYESYGLGLGTPVPFSAEHAEGLSDLYGEILDRITKAGIDPFQEAQASGNDEGEKKPAKDGPSEGDMDFQFKDDWTRGRAINLAIVGRPNAGKSTLINRYLGEDRLITGPEAGLTRDAIAVDWAWNNQAIRLFDTAGLRKKARVVKKLEKLSVADGLRAVRFAHVVVVIIDATLGFEKQDIKIVELAANEGRAIVLAINKWDLVDDRLAVTRQIKDVLARSMPQLKGLMMVPISALTGKGLEKLMTAVFESFALWNARVGTSQLNRFLEWAQDNHPPPMVSGRRLKIRYGAQIKTRPPTVTLYVNRPQDMPSHYLRYLENEFRATFELPATPLRFLMRKGKNPYSKRR